MRMHGAVARRLLQRDRHGQHPRRQCRILKCQVSGLRDCRRWSAPPTDQGPDGWHRKSSATTRDRKRWRSTGRPRLYDRKNPGCDGCINRCGRLAARRAWSQPSGRRASGRSRRAGLRSANSGRSCRGDTSGAVQFAGTVAPAAQSGADTFAIRQFPDTSAGRLF